MAIKDEILSAADQFADASAVGAHAAGKKPDFEKATQFKMMIRTAVENPILSWFLVCVGFFMGLCMGFIIGQIIAFVFRV